MATKQNGGRVATIYNPTGATLKLVNGGSSTVSNNRSSNSNRGRNRKKKTNPTAVQNAASNPNGNSGRGRRRRRSNPSREGFGVVIKQLALGGAGAFAVNTATQLLPIQLSNPIMNLGVRAGLAYAIGAGAKKVLGNDMGNVVRIGGFAVVAGEAVNIFMPNLQQRILQFSPVTAAPRAVVGGNAAVPAAAPAPAEQARLAGIVDYSEDAFLSDVDDIDDDGMSGLVSIPRESPLYGSSYYYG